MLNNHAKRSGTDALKTLSKRAIQKTAEATGNLIGNEIVVKLQRSQKLHHRMVQVPLTNETVNHGLHTETLKKRYVSGKTDNKLLII